MSTSVCSCHPSHTLGDSGVQDILCRLHEDWHIPMAPPTAAAPPPPSSSSSRGPNAPALSHYVGEMFGGLSVPACRTVSKHNASQWAPSQFVSLCVLPVGVWMIFSSTEILSSPAEFFSHSSKTRQGTGWLLQSRGVTLKCLSIVKWPV